MRRFGYKSGILSGLGMFGTAFCFSGLPPLSAAC